MAAVAAPSEDELLEIVAIARRAARVILDVYATAFVVDLKGPNDPVTRADREANDLICGELEARFPGHAIVAEESVPTDPAVLAGLVQSERVFFVDPLDGTREFADRNGEFVVMIGLTIAGRPALGVVVSPTTGQVLAGRVGEGGFLEESGGARRPLLVSTETDPSAARLMVSRSHRPRLAGLLCTSLGITREIPCGSVGLKVARLAVGEAELYAHAGLGAQRWDTCGPEAILVAAGGRFTDLSGQLIDYRDPDLVLRNGILASNGILHDAVLRAVQGAG